MSIIGGRWIWDIDQSGHQAPQISPPTPPPTSKSSYSQPSSLVCLSGRWPTDASRGSSACCWAPSGFSSARWCWPGASAGSPATYPETWGECAEGERQGREGRNALAGRQHPSQQQQYPHQHIWYAWLNGMGDNTTDAQEKMGCEVLTITLTREYAGVLLPFVKANGEKWHLGCYWSWQKTKAIILMTERVLLDTNKHYNHGTHSKVDDEETSV